MSYKAQREYDPNTAGGIATNGAKSVLINGLPAGNTLPALFQVHIAML
jgi:hypothetical protein